MKWNGIVSQLSQRHIATRFAAAKTTHAISRLLSRRNAIPRMPNGLDGVGAQLLPQAPDADVDDIRARIEVVAPDRREQPFAADDLARMHEEVVQKPELAVGEIRQPLAEVRLTAGEVEPEPAGLDDVAVSRRVAAELDADPSDQLVERERLREVVVGAELEPAQLRREVGPRGDDHDRQIGAPPPELGEHHETVDAREQEVEDDEVVPHAFGAPERFGAVAGRVDREAF